MPQLEPEHIIWCHRLFATLSEEGTWTLPRSGLTFTKRWDALVLTSRMPWSPALGGSPESWSRHQDEDYEINRIHFEAAGIRMRKDL